MPEKEPSRTSRKSAPTTPSDYPVVPPPTALAAVDHSFLLQSIMEVQKTAAQTGQAVTMLIDDFKDMRKKGERMSHIMYSVGVVGTILLAILIFFANKIADVVVAGFKASPHP